MAIQKNQVVLPQLFAEPGTRGDRGGENMQSTIDAARRTAFTAAIDTFKLLADLPGAYLRSQKREMKRLQRIASDDDPRIRVMHESIRQARTLHTTAQLGQRRVERLLVALADSEALVHGFVSDGQLKPAAGLTIRLSLKEGGSHRSFQERTDEAGYFRFRLGTDSRPYKPGSQPTESKMSASIAEALARVNAKSAAGASARAATAPGAQLALARLEIFDAADKSLHVDPQPMQIDAGSVYREYVLVDGRSVDNDDPRGFRDQDTLATVPKSKPEAPSAAVTPAPAKRRDTRSAKPRGK